MPEMDGFQTRSGHRPTPLAVGQRPHELTGLLRHPRTVPTGRATREMDASTTDLKEHQYVDRPQEQRIHSEEVTGLQLFLVIPHNTISRD